MVEHVIQADYIKTIAIPVQQLLQEQITELQLLTHDLELQLLQHIQPHQRLMEFQEAVILLVQRIQYPVHVRALLTAQVAEVQQAQVQQIIVVEAEAVHQVVAVIPAHHTVVHLIVQGVHQVAHIQDQVVEVVHVALVAEEVLPEAEDDLSVTFETK